MLTKNREIVPDLFRSSHRDIAETANAKREEAIAKWLPCFKINKLLRLRRSFFSVKRRFSNVVEDIKTIYDQ